jgi:hypothetical protein
METIILCTVVLEVLKVKKIILQIEPTQGKITPKVELSLIGAQFGTEGLSAELINFVPVKD